MLSNVSALSAWVISCFVSFPCSWFLLWGFLTGLIPPFRLNFRRSPYSSYLITHGRNLTWCFDSSLDLQISSFRFQIGDIVNIPSQSVVEFPLYICVIFICSGFELLDTDSNHFHVIHLSDNWSTRLPPSKENYSSGYQSRQHSYTKR